MTGADCDGGRDAGEVCPARAGAAVDKGAGDCAAHANESIDAIRHGTNLMRNRFTLLCRVIVQF